MSLRRACPWVALAVGVTAVVGILYYRAEASEATARAEAADSIADAAAARADRRQQAVDSLASRSDSLEGRLDAVSSREQAVRDSLRRALTVIDRRLEADLADAEGAWAALDTALVELRRRAPPRLQGLVREVTERADTARANALRIRTGLRAKVSLLEADTASKRRELTQVRLTLSGVTEERDSLRLHVDGLRGALDRMTDARDRWKDAARRSPLEVLLGDGLLAGATNVALGALTCTQDPGGACVGWAAENGRRILVAGR